MNRPAEGNDHIAEGDPRIADTHIPWAPGFMGPIAERVRREVGIPVASAWGFGTPQVAERAVKEGQLDLAMIGRALCPLAGALPQLKSPSGGRRRSGAGRDGLAGCCSSPSVFRISQVQPSSA
ncbi:hypothetical protein SAMN04244572_02973 [Azotobacter beijerinckii]|uniref:NADH:flavin oxidoreductase / NADH oxidase family protein n=1 Tax=Azotobacter beijerinckii TaxID=170623 RepID=A0A1H6WWD1_9GAMM|nr:hypothetical protein SAMN04244572_02973 [Azotobacter beijerinckii]SEJ21231.1 hypothetical protein SAMN04244579_03511 [Azotobacter beijerinckii]